MSPEQKEYLQAKAMYEAVSEAVINDERSLPPITQGTSDVELDRITEMIINIQRKHGYSQALDAFIEAKNNLLLWGQKELQKHTLYANSKDELDTLFTRCKYHPTIRNQLIDAIMKLSV